MSQVSSLPPSKRMVVLNIQSSLVTVHGFPNLEYLGLLESHMGTVVTELSKNYLFDHLAYLPEIAESDIAERISKRSLHIIISSKKEWGDGIGEFLSENDVFLQHPYKEDIFWPYKNPQYFLRPGESFTPLPEDYSQPSDAAADSNTQLDTSILDDIYASASGPDDYTSVQPSSRLATSLQR